MESWILMILVIMPGVWSGDWSVSYENQCALKGTSVVIKCSYDYPFGHFVTSVDWYKVFYISGQKRLVSLSRLRSPPGHFKYVGNYRSICDLEITNIQHSDQGAYYFGFETSFDRWKSKTSTHLSVKELITVVQPSTVTVGDYVSLTCVSGCPTPTTSVWFRDGQPVLKPVFQARREDAGRYYCAVLGQETVRSASVALNVQYAPRKVTLVVSPSGDIVSGSSVTFTCSSDANPPVTQSGYSLYKDGRFISSGWNYTISGIQPGHSGLYHCQAWNNISWEGIDLIKSSEIHFDVQYPPMNISISLDRPQVAEGSSVNLTCSSVANPAVEGYTWYKRIDSPSYSPGSGSGPMLQVGSGQVLSLPSAEASHAGFYLCQARNSVGRSNSPEVLLTMTRKKHGSLHVSVVAGVGALLFVMVVIPLLLYHRRKQGTHVEEKQTVGDTKLSGRRSSSSADQDQSDNVYANIQTFPTSPSFVAVAQDIDCHSQRNWQHENEDSTSYEDEVTYSTVTIKPTQHGFPHHIKKSRAPEDSWSKAGESEDSVIYTTVATSSLSTA